jgi:hypothetical protein
LKSPDNSALEQTAATSRSWQRRQGARSGADARQERAGPPLLTAGVRCVGSPVRRTVPLHLEILAILPAVLLALGGCGLATVCKRSGSHPIDSSCLVSSLTPGEEVWVYTDAGRVVHGVYVRTVEKEPVGLIMKTLPLHDHSDTAQVSLMTIEKVSRPRLSSRAGGGVLFGLIVVGVAAFWWAAMSAAGVDL